MSSKADEQLCRPQRFTTHSKQSRSDPRTEYKLETDVGIGCFIANAPADIDKRPVSVFRWAFDDLIVEQLWDNGDASSLASSSHSSSASSSHLVVDVTAEGLGDSELMEMVRARLGMRAGAAAADGHELFLSGTSDFACCSSRRLMVPASAVKPASSFAAPQVIHGARGGVAFLSAAVAPPRGTVPRSVRYTAAFRGCDTSIRSVTGRVAAAAENGFVNYTANAMHGFHLSRAFSSGLSLMQREYTSFLCRYLYELTEGCEALNVEVQRVCDLLMDPTQRTSSKEWKSIRLAMHHAKQQSRNVISRPSTGIYAEHVDMLIEFVERCEGLHPDVCKDSAKIVRETVSRRVLQDKLRALTDVHFNAWATLRLQVLGRQVRVGDVVMDRSSMHALSALDPYTTRHDHSFAIGEHLFYDNFSSNVESSPALRVVESEKDAAKYSLCDVVLPLFGRTTAEQLFPRHSCGKAVSDELAVNLRLEPLRHLQLAPACAYRPLVVRPLNVRSYLIDDIRGIVHGDAALGTTTFLDSEGIRRISSPLRHHLGGHNGVVRPGIAGYPARDKFLSIATKPGFTTVLQFELPSGSSMNSLVREIFKTKTVDPTALFRMIKQGGTGRRK